MLHNPTCAAQHIDMWMIKSDWLADALSTIKAGLWKMRNQDSIPVVKDMSESGSDFFEITKDGIAILSLHGPLMKPWSKYGGTSTVFVRQKLRQISGDPSVRGIMLHIDSPGGTVSGTHDLAEEVQRASTKKPVFAHIDDLGASAAYWVASQASRVTANATALVGSIGTYSVVYDQSKQAELMGIKVHVISTGDFKGAGITGSEITEDMLLEMQARVNDLNSFFLKGVMNGRNMAKEDLDKVADGRVFIANEARSQNLIDKVTSFDKAYEDALAQVNRIEKQRSVNSQVRGSKV